MAKTLVWKKIENGYKSACGKAMILRCTSEESRLRNRHSKGITKTIVTWAPYVDDKYVGCDEMTLKDAKEVCERASRLVK